MSYVVGDTVRIVDRKPDDRGGLYTWEGCFNKYLGTHAYIYERGGCADRDYHMVMLTDGITYWFRETWFAKAEHPYKNLKVGDRLKVLSKPVEEYGNTYAWRSNQEASVGQYGILHAYSWLNQTAILKFEDGRQVPFHYLWLEPPARMPLYVIVVGPRAEPHSIPEVHKDAAIAAARAVALGGEAVELAKLGDLA